MVTVGRLFAHAAVLAALSAPLMAASCCDCDCDEAGTTPGGTGEACTTEGEQRPCYSGAATTVDIGVCQRGSQTCSAGEWTACEGEIVPSSEECDDLDNDCDGVTDESCPCDDGATQTCYSGPPLNAGIGSCVTGTQVCDSETWGPCDGEVLPEDETCDGTDNDCNGVSDEGCTCVDGTTQPCYSGGQGTQGVGLCQAGTQSCAGGEWSTDCAGEVTPTGESCNSQDDDCDGSTDEGDVCCSPSCVSHHACGGDGCGGNCGSCSGDRWCWNGYCVWDHGNNGSETCHTICFWGGSNCVGTSSHSCSTEGIGGIDCYCW